MTNSAAVQDAPSGSPTPAPSSPKGGTGGGFGGWLDRYFLITDRGSTIGREVRGGLVTFFSMCYIIVLNPAILGFVKDADGHFLGGGDAPNLPAIAATTALVAGLMTILMGSVAKFPLAVAAGLGLNAALAGLVGGGVLTWPDAMGLIVIEGLVILVLVLTGFRAAVFKAVPSQIKVAISVGIGLFITLVGLVNAGFVRGGVGTPLQLGVDGSLDGFPVVVFIVGLLVTIVLMVRKVRGAILIGILSAAVLAVVGQLIGHIPTQRNAEGVIDTPTGWGLNAPQLDGSPVTVPDFSLIGKFSLLGAVEKIGVLAVILLVFSLMLADFFDTMGTMVAIGAEGDLLDKDGNPPRTKQILVIDSLAAAAGGAASISSNTSYIESATGVGEGARTGLANIVTGCAFLLATFLSPLVNLIPQEAATPALVVVGFLMMTQVAGIKWNSLELAIPAFLTIVVMPFTYSISAGIGAGFIAYVVLMIAKGKIKKIHPIMWLIGGLFVVYFALGPIERALGM